MAAVLCTDGGPVMSYLFELITEPPNNLNLISRVVGDGCWRFFGKLGVVVSCSRYSPLWKLQSGRYAFSV
jgi:hypothetical protein